MTVDVVLFAEDPGAGNFIAPLPGSLRERGLQCLTIGTGPALDSILRADDQGRSLSQVGDLSCLVETLQPSVIVTGTSTNRDSYGLQLISQSAAASVSSVGVIDMPMSADVRFRGRSQDPLAFAPDWLVVPDRWTHEEYLRLGFRRQQVIIGGHPHYDYVRRVADELRTETKSNVRHRTLSGCPDDRPVIVYATEGSSQKMGDPSTQELARRTLHGRGSTGRTEVALEEVIDAVKDLRPKPYLILRLHPKDHEVDFAEYAGEVDEVSQFGSSLELAFSADLVVGITTMMLLEAALLGRATLAVLPNPGEASWLPTIRNGATIAVSERQILASTIESLLKDESTSSTGALDDETPANSVIRTTDFLCGLVRNGRETNEEVS